MTDDKKRKKFDVDAIRDELLRLDMEEAERDPAPIDAETLARFKEGFGDKFLEKYGYEFGSPKHKAPADKPLKDLKHPDYFFSRIEDLKERKSLENNPKTGRVFPRREDPREIKPIQQFLILKDRREINNGNLNPYPRREDPLDIERDFRRFEKIEEYGAFLDKRIPSDKDPLSFDLGKIRLWGGLVDKINRYVRDQRNPPSVNGVLLGTFGGRLPVPALDYGLDFGFGDEVEVNVTRIMLSQPNPYQILLKSLGREDYNSFIIKDRSLDVSIIRDDS